MSSKLTATGTSTKNTTNTGKSWFDLPAELRTPIIQLAVQNTIANVQDWFATNINDEKCKEYAAELKTLTVLAHTKVIIDALRKILVDWKKEADQADKEWNTMADAQQPGTVYDVAWERSIIPAWAKEKRKNGVWTPLPEIWLRVNGRARATQGAVEDLERVIRMFQEA